MGVTSILQTAIADTLAAEGPLRAAVPIIAIVNQPYPDAIVSALGSHNIGIVILPPQMDRAMQGVPFVFFERATIRVRIVEQPALNDLGVTAFDLMEDIANALHWEPRTPTSPLASILSHPLQIAEKPTELISDPTYRIIDVIFEATFELPTNSNSHSS